MERQITERTGDFWISPARPCDEPIDVTVVIPSFENETTLRRAIASVLAQSLRNVEIIVGDDASTDGSWRLVTEWLPEEPRLRAFRNHRNCGKSAVMNRALSFARGRWIAVLDADDWYHPDRLATLVEIGTTSQADIVADNQFLYDAAADTVISPAWPAADANWPLTFDDYLLGSNVYDNFDFGMLKPLVRTEFVRSTQLAYDERARYGEDFLYLLQFFILGGKATICAAPYYFYTQPYGTLSRQWSHPTRRRYDFQLARDLTQCYLRANAGRLTPHQSRQLKRRVRRLASLESYFCAKESLQRHEWRGLLRRLVDRPAMLDCIGRRLWRRCARRAATPAAVHAAEVCRQRAAGGLSAPSDRQRIPFPMPVRGNARRVREWRILWQRAAASPGMAGNALTAVPLFGGKTGPAIAVAAIGSMLALLL
jgi:succinoglycan biosynthesis protein ExoO